jgi:hypothetical protein
MDGGQTVAATATSVSGFELPLVSIDVAANAPGAEPPMSPFSKEPTISFAHLQRLGRGEGEILYHPTKVPLAIGDVLYLRERSVPDEAGRVEETGVVVQVIGIGTANYQAAEQKSLFRLMTAVRADELKRSYHEPPETLDEFMEARVQARCHRARRMEKNHGSGSHPQRRYLCNRSFYPSPGDHPESTGPKS